MSVFFLGSISLKNIIFCLLFLVTFSFSAIAEPRFDADINVDVTANTVTEAKQKAISKAIREGLSEVVLNVSTENSVNEINKLNDNQLQHFITGVMVLMEKTSDVRYIANLRISVNKEILKAYMAENKMPFIVGESQEVVVVPMIEKEDGSSDVWGDDNFWRQAFLERENLHKANMNIRLIDKNLGNIAMVKVNRLFDMINAEYQEFANFNRADAVYVLKYSLRDKKIYIKNYPEGGVQSIDIGEESVDELIDKCVALFRDVKKIKSEGSEEGAASQRVDVVYSYSKLSDWIKLKNMLNDNPQVQDIKIVSMANGKVHFNFQYSGIIEKLQGNMESSGYKMKSEGEYYAIY